MAHTPRRPQHHHQPREQQAGRGCQQGPRQQAARCCQALVGAQEARWCSRCRVWIMLLTTGLRYRCGCQGTPTTTTGGCQLAQSCTGRAPIHLAPLRHRLATDSHGSGIQPGCLCCCCRHVLLCWCHRGRRDRRRPDPSTDGFAETTGVATTSWAFRFCLWCLNPAVVFRCVCVGGGVEHTTV